jgi:hypothetical protein
MSHDMRLLIINLYVYVTLDNEIWNYKDKSKIIGKTPDYTIQAIVQRDRRFTRIGLGVYALTDYLEKLPKIVEPKNEVEKIGNIIIFKKINFFIHSKKTFEYEEKIEGCIFIIKDKDTDDYYQIFIRKDDNTIFFKNQIFKNLSSSLKYDELDKFLTLQAINEINNISIDFKMEFENNADRNFYKEELKKIIEISNYYDNLKDLREGDRVVLKLDGEIKENGLTFFKYVIIFCKKTLFFVVFICHNIFRIFI